MAQITTTEHIRHCPVCNGTKFTKDYKREETYCNKCGLVISSAFQYVGLEKIQNTVPHSPAAEARHIVHYTWIYKGDKGKVNNRNITTYKHHIPDRKLMKKGHR